MAKALARCPVCDSMLGISELACAHCRTTIHGVFDPCRFCRLSSEHLAFIELFLRCEGNLSRVEKEMNLSYPTVRNRLGAALTALGLSGEEVAEPTPPVSPAPEISPEMLQRRRELLESLERGELSAEDAAEALRELT